MSADRSGTELAGYAVKAEIGRGGMGIVYRADQLAANGTPRRTVALKVLDPDLAGDQEFRQRFLRESEIAMAIEHPNIIPIYDAGEQDGVLYLAMRFVDGVDLGRLLELRGPLSPARAVELLDPVARALDAAHARGLVHRDIKPANVLVGGGGPDGEGDEIVYLTDFGITKRTATTTSLTQAGIFMGTPSYAAPEQFEGGAVDRRADVYSLACVLFECLTGRLPYQRDSDVSMMLAHVRDPVPSLRSVRPDLPPALDEVVTRGMAKDPGERYGTSRALVAAARAALAQPATPPSPSIAVTQADAPLAPPQTPPQTPAPGSAWAPPPPGATVGANQWQPPPPAPGWAPPAPPGPPPRRKSRAGLVVVLVLVTVVVLGVAGIATLAALNDGGTPTTTTAVAGPTTTTIDEAAGAAGAAKLKAFFSPISDANCSTTPTADRLVGAAQAEIRCKPDSKGVDVSYVYFGTRQVMDDYTKFLQRKPEGIRVSADTTWKYTDRPGDVGDKVAYYHPSSDTSYLYWTYADDLMGAIASRDGNDEAALEKWWVDVDVLRNG